ncbi:MAG: hypothetical protein CUN56_09920 [Phototrophicales bacterium]|nr:MAG: hypothetical protein CUN56_09920 [Phototrophicales bacterium]RMG77999.1 MAG: FHA domain-containing protein [Chloroflexota bacterium]
MEKIYTGLQFAWLENKCIAAYRVENLAMDVMVEWSDHVINLLKNWQPDGFNLFLFDISTPGIGSSYLVMTGRELFNVGITRAGYTRVEQLMQQRQAQNPNAGIRVALVASPDPSGQIIRRYSGTARLDVVMGKLFFQHQDAVRWLLAQNQPAITTKTSELKQKLQIMINRLQSNTEPSDTQQQELVLLINGAVERVSLNGRNMLTIGRKTRDGQHTVDIDLSSYGDSASSVSRRHARLLLDDNAIMIMDLGSTNGTYIAGEKLIPHEPRRITPDDLIHLGRVSLSILL